MPFGEYKDFADCVAHNKEKSDPEAYCAWLEHEITGEWPSEKEIKKKGEKDVNVNKDQNAKDSLEERLNQVRRAFESGEMGESNSMVIHVFEDAVITQQFGTGKYFEIGYKITEDGNITKDAPKEVDLIYIQKRINGNSAELTGPIFKADKKQRIVYAAVLVPGEPDHDFEKGEKILSAEEIEHVAHKWLEDYGNIDYMHGMNNVAKPVESYLLPMELDVTIAGEKTKLPKGAWVMAGKVTNDKAWKKVESGDLTGFSIMGIQNNVLKDIMKKVAEGEPANKQFESSLKRVLIRDLGKDWIVPFVSLVDEPCVPKAKFFAIKEKEKTGKEIEQEDKESIWTKVVNYFKKDDKNQKNLEGDEIDMKEEEVLKMIEEKIEEKLKPVLEGIESLKKQEPTKETKTEKTKEAEKTEKAKEPENDKTEIEKLKEQFEALKSENEELKKQKDGKSKVEKGQEDGKTKKVEKSIYEELGRDEFGRKKEKGDDEDV